jgi:hypothetical protein
MYFDGVPTQMSEPDLNTAPQMDFIQSPSSEPAAPIDSLRRITPVDVDLRSSTRNTTHGLRSMNRIIPAGTPVQYRQVEQPSLIGPIGYDALD